ncbi:MAG TPA: glutathione peroxidase [Polyangiaceae bacterium]|nr:glutathione peroxidase [Polyangiaceae bacterium]
MADPTDLFRIPVVSIDGEQTTLEPWRGKVLLIVNVASACGFTPQYEGLEALWRKYRDRGLVVLGFPCNQFGKQEPGCDADIQHFAKQQYAVSFPLFSKIEVNGKSAHPLYQLLKSAAPGLLGTEAIKWNFTKFLVDRRGEVVARFASRTTPRALEPELERLLAQG